MKKQTQSRILVFALAFLAWLGLTAGGGVQEVVAGAVVALVVALITGRFLAGFPRRGVLRRAGFAVLYFFRFLWEMIKANVHVAGIVLHPLRPIKPGIVKIRTELTNDVAMTILANSITLTPGTLTVDINPEAQELYIHCITVEGTDIAENTKRIGDRFERILKEVFE
ncbi:MAG: Na+/H+ antiporter subunit E [Candidatus Aminicenantes bacterium]|nr:Na+/H+ antiporter subunit E [Candidatus Aminicenantes bacterium]